MNANQLKNSILQLAVQGKLVPQDPNDEPASVLIQKIRAEKDKLIKEKKIKKEKNPSYIFRGSDNLHYEKVGDGEPVCIEEQLPFEIPDSWVWVRFGNIVHYSIGKTPRRGDPEYWSNPKYNWVSIADLVSDGHVNKTKEQISAHASETVFINKPISPSGTLLMSFKLTVGKVSILNINAYHNEAIISIFPFLDENKIIRNYLFRTLPLLSKLGNTTKAMKGATLNRDSIGYLLIPIPPLAEQQRIFSKIDQIFPFINNFELLKSRVIELNNKFPEQLKESILEQAVQGKLVPQDPSDEPASFLLERIREEKARLIKEGKIKKDKNESVIFIRDNSYYEKFNGVERCIDEEIPFEIPNSWEWVRFGNIVTFAMGKTPPRGETEFWNHSDYNWVSITDLVSDGYVNKTKEKVSKFASEKIFSNGISKAGTLLMSFKLTIGKTSILNIDAYHNEAIISIYPLNDDGNITRDFLFRSLPLLSKMSNTKSAIKGSTLNETSLSNILIPFPPINEQKRIVETMDKALTSYTKLCEII